jgi:hypothetical protein
VIAAKIRKTAQEEAPSRRATVSRSRVPHISILNASLSSARDAGEGAWRPLFFCDLGCKMNLDKIPCHVPVNNKCDRTCNQFGQGLNLRHCLINIAKTQCNEPVTDNCNNVCGFVGQKDCDRGTDATTVGALVVNSYDMSSDASYRLSVGTLEPLEPAPPGDNALYLDFMKDGKAVDVPGEEDNVRPAAILKMKYLKEELVRRELDAPPPDPDYRTALGSHNTEAVKTYAKEGIELMPPSDTAREGGQPHIVRVGMQSEFTGGYIKLGTGSEEAHAHDARQEAFTGRIVVLQGVHTFSSQPGPAARAGFGKWNPELRRMGWGDKHRLLRIDDPGHLSIRIDRVIYRSIHPSFLPSVYLHLYLSVPC